jgi:hypothetical protein
MPDSRLIKNAAAMIAAGLLGVSAPAMANEEDVRLWTSFVAEGKFSDQYRWTAEVQPRFRNDAKDADQLIIRPSVSYVLTDRSSISLGFAYVETDTGQRVSKEDRLWQQFSYASKMGDLSWSSRTRLEQRSLDVADETSHRLRQMLRASHPVSQGSAWNVLGWNELFVNLNDTPWAGRSGINQNRLFTGVMWRYSQKSRIEVGYLNQLINTPSGRENQMNHVLSSTWFIGF